jgi:hypothetical protein
VKKAVIATGDSAAGGIIVAVGVGVGIAVGVAVEN